jgi:hypothetical protein
MVSGSHRAVSVTDISANIFDLEKNTLKTSWGSSVSLMSDYRLDNCGSILAEAKGILF